MGQYRFRFPGDPPRRGPRTTLRADTLCASRTEARQSLLDEAWMRPPGDEVFDELYRHAVGLEGGADEYGTAQYERAQALLTAIDAAISALDVSEGETPDLPALLASLSAAYKAGDE